MIELENISKIGYGAYKVSINNQEHFKSLAYALKSGCNLIDTASNYSNGESEQLIGKMVSELGNDKMFIITKAGYIQGKDLKNAAKYNFKNTAKIDDGFWYSLNVDFINYQIRNSLDKLKTNRVDGFLLHNPEHYFDSNDLAINKDKIYQLITEAFSLLEEKVKDGKIRYYGMSSNTLPFSIKNENTLSLTKISSLANDVSINNHFKLVQFPFNYFEQEATTEIHSDGESLINTSKRLGLTTFSNRPLNANAKDGIVRLATYESDLANLDESKINNSFEEVFQRILSKLKDHGMENQWKDFPILVHLHDNSNWKKIANPEAVDKIFREHFYPFLNSLFEDSIPESFNQLLKVFYQGSILYSKKRMTERAQKIESDLIKVGLISENGEPLSYKFCKYYLTKGIDHILVGMRKEKYVEDMKHGFMLR